MNTIKSFFRAISKVWYGTFVPSLWQCLVALDPARERREIGRYSAAYEWAIPFRTDNDGRGGRKGPRSLSHSLLGPLNSALICERRESYIISILPLEA